MKCFIVIVCSVFVGMSLGHIIFNPETVDAWTYMALIINTIPIIVNTLE